MAISSLTIDGPRIRLRRFTEQDEDSLLWLAADPGFRAEVDEVGPDMEGIRAYLAKKATYADFEVGMVFDLAVEIRTPPQVIGLVTLFRRPPDQGEVGYALHSSEHGNGYATEAAEALINHAFGHLDLHRVHIRTRSTNAPAAAVATKLGMRLEGRLVEAAGGTGRRADMLLFGLLQSEWASRL